MSTEALPPFVKAMKALLPLLTFLAVSQGSPPSRAEALCVCVTATAPGAAVAFCAARDKAARTERRTGVTAARDPARGKARLAGCPAIPPVDDGSGDTPEEAPEETPVVTGARLVISRPAAAAAAVRNDPREAAPTPPAEAEAATPAAGAMVSGGGDGGVWSWGRLASLLLLPLVLALLLPPLTAWAVLRRGHG